MTSNSIFERTETKYMITEEQQHQLLGTIAPYIVRDTYGKSTVCNLYFDTDDFLLIRTSMEKPVYKEKLRLRSYGIPSAASQVFLELKKKYKGIVYKRRETLPLAAAEDYLTQHILPNHSQIMNEIDWCMKYYKHIHPTVYISYDREAFYAADDHDQRLTFDRNILYRTNDLDMRNGIYGQKVLRDRTILLEIKALNAMPLWLCEALNTLHIYPCSFSKYGTVYQMIRQHKTHIAVK